MNRVFQEIINKKNTFSLIAMILAVISIFLDETVATICFAIIGLGLSSF